MPSSTSPSHKASSPRLEPESTQPATESSARVEAFNTPSTDTLVESAVEQVTEYRVSRASAEPLSCKKGSMSSLVLKCIAYPTLLISAGATLHRMNVLPPDVQGRLGNVILAVESTASRMGGVSHLLFQRASILMRSSMTNLVIRYRGTDV